MKILIATVGALATLVLTTPTAQACEVNCYDSGNTGYHCVSDC